MKKTSVITYILSLAAMAACTSQQSKNVDEQAGAETDSIVSAFAKPLFDDPNGEMDSIFRANGYEYSKGLENAVMSGDMDATQMLAMMYAYGIGGVKPDIKKTYKLYLKLAESGDANAMAYVGYMMLYEGVGPVQDEEAGIEWLEKSANLRCPTAFYYLGNYFEQTGKIQEAKTCYQNAVALGMEQAKYDLEKLSR